MKVIKKDHNSYFERQLESRTNYGQFKDIKNGISNYYVIKHEEEVIERLYIYNDKPEITIDKAFRVMDGLYESLINYLKKDYKYLYVRVDKFNEESVNLVESSSKIISQEEKSYFNYTDIIYKIDLSDEINYDLIDEKYIIEKQTEQELLEYYKEHIKDYSCYKDIKYGLASYYEIEDENEIITTFIINKLNGTDVMHIQERYLESPIITKNIIKEISKDYNEINVLFLTEKQSTIENISKYVKSIVRRQPKENQILVNNEYIITIK